MELNFSRKDAAFRHAVRTFIAENYQMAEAISAISELSKAREDAKARSWFGVSYLRSPRDSDYRRGAHAA